MDGGGGTALVVGSSWLGCGVTARGGGRLPKTDRGRLRLRLKLDFLASLVVRGRREAHSLPDRIHARRVELDRADLDVKAKRAAHLRLLRRLVHLVAEALRVELVLERTLRDHGLALPEVVEADARTLQEAKVLHAEG